MTNSLTEREKIHSLYQLIGERGLYVNTNYDIFTKPPEEVEIIQGRYRVPLTQLGSHAYSSPLLFAALTSLLNHGTMMVRGAPGIGKTTGCEVAGHFFTGTSLDDILQAEILGNPQLKTEDVIAGLDIAELTRPGGRKVVIPTKFLQCPVKIWDEINRTPADLVSSAMKLVDTGKAVYQGKVLQSPPGVLFATANYEDEGTFQLTPPFLDRFDVAVMVTSPQPWDLRKIRQRGDEKTNGNLDRLLQIPEELRTNLGQVREQINGIKETTEYDIPQVSAFADFLYGSLRFSDIASTNLARATKGNAWQVTQDNADLGHFNAGSHLYAVNELSIRTVKAMMRYAKAFAWLTGKEQVELSDLKTVLPYLLWHKIQPTRHAIANKPQSANDRISLVEEIIKIAEIEYNDMCGSPANREYALALGALETGMLLEKKLKDDELRTVVRNAIQRVGGIDKPYAVTMAAHLATRYNERNNGAQ